MGKRTVMIAGTMGFIFALHAAGVPGAAESDASSQTEATAALKDAEGNNVGSVALKQGPHGTLLHARLTGLPPGTHAIHVHTVGACEPPDFESAGGHYNPDQQQHGYFNNKGIHAGDLPNIHVPESGTLEAEFFSERLKLSEDLFAGDGTALVIHSDADDYHTDPAGNAGGRIACGVIERE